MKDTTTQRARVRKAAIWLPALAACLAVACAPTPPRLANPASVNCINQGGKLLIAKRGDGGQYGICYFADNRQCEEWALFRGFCPPGGRRITGYITDAARYCVLVGGEYQVAAPATSASPERGTCRTRDGRQCDADAFYAGGC